MKNFIAAVGAAKSAVDNGFSRAGKRLKTSDSVSRALMLCAARGVAVSNAVVVLADRSQPNEALPLLRSLAELSAAAGWIVEKESAPRAAAFLKEAETGSWREFFDDARLAARLKAAGAPALVGERALMSCRDHILANAQGLPWGHVFAGGAPAGLTPEELVEAAAACMGLLVKALQRRWPEDFEDAATPHKS